MGTKRALVRRMAAWCCVAALAVLVAATAMSNWYWFVWEGKNVQRRARSSRGVVGFSVRLRRLPPGAIVIGADGPGPGWHCGKYHNGGNYFNSHPVEPWQWGASASTAGDVLRVAVPLWIPIVAVTLAAVPLWWPDVRACRRRRTGLCRSCGYDRSGLIDAPCPECGAK